MKRAPVLKNALLLAAMATLPSCSILGLKKQVGRLEANGGITVRVSPPPKDDPPTYAVAWRFEDGQRKDSAGVQQVKGSGIASFYLRAEHLYRVGAFTDENRNHAYDAGEPIAVLKDVKPFPLTETAAGPGILDLALTRDRTLPPGTTIQIPPPNKELGGKVNIALGEVAPLDDPRFKPDTGGTGLWRPLDFLTDNTLGIYFTEPYDPKRIPVLLVYGIGGSPQDWKYFIDHFDRKRHQLWFFHYPSGMRLDRVSRALATGIRLLKEHHRFERMDVMAHSMGGLVARTALCEAVSAEGRNFIPKFVSVSTPWGGHKAAESGIRHLKKPVPSWLDVRPGSDFLLKLYATPLPRGTSHHLIYGSIKKGPFWLKGPNDGVVTVESETDLRIKPSTSSFKHLLHEHVEILENDETLKLVEGLLAR